MSPLISIIVPVYNQWHLIPELVGCLEKQSYRKFELLLVDNNSDEAPVLENPPAFVTCMSCRKPGSYAARNHGAKQAKGELLSFTDADCRPFEDWLNGGVTEYNRHSAGKTIIAGAVVMVPRDPSSPNYFELYDMMTGIPQAQYVKRGYAATANLFVPADLFFQLSGFDPDRFSGGDAEFCRRAVRHGANLVFCSNARVKHIARDHLDTLMKKIRRVKGGQLCCGSGFSRFAYGIRALLPPLNAWLKICRAHDFSLSRRLIAGLIQARLSLAEAAEVIRLGVFRKRPDR